MEPVIAEMQQKSWQVMLHADLAASALAIARSVAGRLRDEERLKTACELSVQQSEFPYLIRDYPSRISAGGAGLVCLYSAFDACFPEEDWDVAAHRQLERAARTLRARDVTEQALSIFSGLSGMAFATWIASRSGTRYQRLLATIERQLFPAVAGTAERVLVERPHGCKVSLYDAISGFAGAGAYLLCRTSDPAAYSALRSVLACLIYLTEETDGLFHCHIPADPGRQDTWTDTYPDGHVNCGLAHGIPGPLALLALARRLGVEAPGLAEAIARTADRLVAQHIEDEWGINWPIAWPVGRLNARPGSRRGGRAAWCYGTPGVARALWLAGEALDCSEYREIALEGMRAVYRRPVMERRIDSPSFCHGIAGLLHITLRFANECDDPCFREAATVLSRQLLDLYQPESLLGYRHLESVGVLVDHPWLLDGAAGIALVLLAAAYPREPRWDRLFLLA